MRELHIMKTLSSTTNLRASSYELKLNVLERNGIIVRIKIRIHFLHPLIFVTDCSFRFKYWYRLEVHFLQILHYSTNIWQQAITDEN